MDHCLQEPSAYRFGSAEFYSADVLFAAETFLINAASAGEALALARNYAEQSPFFNQRIPDLICIVRVQEIPPSF